MKVPAILVRPALLVLACGLALPLTAQSAALKDSKDSLSFNPVGHYRVSIFSPMPMGEWVALVTITETEGHYAATFTSPDGVGSYPVTAIGAHRDTLTITMGGAGAGSVFRLLVRGDSLTGTMTSLANGLTEARGIRLKSAKSSER